MAGTAADAALRVRALAALGAVLLTTAGLLALAAPFLTTPLGPRTELADLLALVCAVLLVAGWARLALGTSVCLLAHLLRRPAGPGTARLRPAAAQRLAALLVGTGLGGLAAPAVALPLATADSPADPVPSAAAPSAAQVAALPLPGRPLGGRVPSSQPVRSGRPPVLVVRPGDSLWSLAAAHLLPSGRSDSEPAVDAAWRRLYAANRAVIGPDPHLIRPGTRLDLPAPAPTEGLP